MMPPMETEGSGGSKTPWVILGIVVLAIVVLGVLFRDKLFGGQSGTAGNTPSATGKSSDYQAVFLTNGQVYFGKLTGAESAYATMSDIFYLQVGPQQGPGTDAAAPQQTIQLVKLGNELHGPVDEMKINRDHILFYEDLKEDGQVVQAVKKYKTDNPAPAK